MAATTISTLTVCKPKCNATRLPSPSCSSLPLQLARLRTQTPARFTSYCCSNNLSATSLTQRRYSTSRRIRAVAEEAEQSVPPEGNGSAEGEPAAATTVDQTVSVQVSPSDILTMFFRAEGTMNETAIPAVTEALELNSGREFSSVSNWEDPDDGNDSEYNSDEEESDLDFESDWEEENNASAAPTVLNGDRNLPASNYDEDLVKEVEQLLSPEEKEILQQNEAPNLKKISTEKWNPLHTFALAGKIRFMDSLLEHSLDIDMIDKDGMTALHHAIIGKKEPVISHLLRKGANLQVRDLDGATPLHYAVQVGAMQTVKLLIKYRVDVNVADHEGWTPLHVAVQGRNRDIVKILLVNGADKSRRNKDGKTALDTSMCYGKDFKSYDLAKLLKVVPANREL